MRVFLPALRHELLEVADRRFEAQPQHLDSTCQYLVGLLPGLAFDDFVADRLVSVDRSDRLVIHGS